MFKAVQTRKELDDIRAKNVIVTQQLKDKVQADTLGAQFAQDQAAAQLQPITQLLKVTTGNEIPRDKQGHQLVTIANLVNDLTTNIAPSMQTTQGKILAYLSSYVNAMINGMTALPPDSALARITYSLERLRTLSEKGNAIAHEQGPDAVPPALEEQLDREFDGIAALFKYGELGMHPGALEETMPQGNGDDNNGSNEFAPIMDPYDAIRRGMLKMKGIDVPAGKIGPLPKKFTEEFAGDIGKTVAQIREQEASRKVEDVTNFEAVRSDIEAHIDSGEITTMNQVVDSLAEIGKALGVNDANALLKYFRKYLEAEKKAFDDILATEEGENQPPSPPKQREPPIKEPKAATTKARRLGIEKAMMLPVSADYSNYLKERANELMKAYGDTTFQVHMNSDDYARLHRHLMNNGYLAGLNDPDYKALSAKKKKILSKGETVPNEKGGKQNEEDEFDYVPPPRRTSPKSTISSMSSSSSREKHSSYDLPMLPKGKGLQIITDPNQLIERLPVLVGAIHAGNNSPKLKNELYEVLDALLNLGAITKKDHKAIASKFAK